MSGFVEFRFRFKVVASLVEGNAGIQNIKLNEGAEKKTTSPKPFLRVMCEKAFAVLIVPI